MGMRAEVSPYADGIGIRCNATAPYTPAFLFGETIMKTILIIDDNVDYRTDLMEILGFEQYDALGAENGLVGLQMIRQFAPDLIICDLDMPVLDGMQVLKALRADPIHAKIPFIVASGRADALTMQTLRDLGADTYLTKPITTATFLTTIGNFLQVKNSV
jgi:CheY-like chemotaxis protein